MHIQRKGKQLAVEFLAQKAGRAQHMEIEQRRVRVAGSLDQNTWQIGPKVAQSRQSSPIQIYSQLALAWVRSILRVQ